MKLESIKKIVVFRALQIGDMLCSIPAIRALHQACPQAEISLVGLPWAKMLIERFPVYFHSLIEFPGYPGFPEHTINRREFPNFLKHVQSQNFDLALQMHGSGVISNPLVDLFGAKNICGFYTPRNYCPDPDLFIEYPAKIHEVHRHLQLMEALGISNAATELEFPLLAKDMEDFNEAALPVTPGKYVVVHPGSRGESRRWSPRNFAAVGDLCIENGLQVVITGTKDETGIVEDVIKQMTNTPLNAAGKTSLGAVAVLIKNAAALVSNCTGVSHVAAALKTKSLVLSLDGEPFRWGPLNQKLHHTIDWTATPSLNLVLEELRTLLFNSKEVGSV